MSDAASVLQTGDLGRTLALVKGEVRKAPREAGLRTFLFQLFCVTAEWERALSQLAVAAELDPLTLPMAETYRTLIRCEGVREGVFAGKRTPTLFGHPLPWAPLLLEANRLLASGETVGASELRDQAFETADTVGGTADAEAIDWIADADPRLGPVLEAIVDGTYYWIPFQHITTLTLDPPADLRDQVWMPANFTWTNGGQSVGFIPTRYPGSAAAGDALALARRTEWIERDGWSLGLGQRMLTAGDVDFPLMDLRRLTLGAAAPA